MRIDTMSMALCLSTIMRDLRATLNVSQSCQGLLGGVMQPRDTNSQVVKASVILLWMLR